MSNTKVYPIASTSNGYLDRSQLRSDLSALNLGVSFSPITVTSTDFTVTTSAALTATQWLLVDAIVHAHEGPVFDPEQTNLVGLIPGGFPLSRTWGLEKWQDNQPLNTSDYVTAYTLTGPSMDFHTALFELSNNQIWFRVQLNGTDLIEVLLSDLLLLRVNDPDILRSKGIWVTSYQNKFWRFSPVEMHVQSQLDLQFKANSGSNRKVVRGYTQLLRH